MEVGMMMVFAGYGWDGCRTTGAGRGDPIGAGRCGLGFDVLWSAEHHFNDYSFVSDNRHLMSHLAAVCPGIGLGTAAIVLRWHDPLRVAENAAVVDLLCKDKLRLGVATGRWPGASSQPSI